jgi:hypothetical protein
MRRRRFTRANKRMDLFYEAKDPFRLSKKKIFVLVVKKRRFEIEGRERALA